MVKAALVFLALLGSALSNANAQYSISVDDVNGVPGTVLSQTVSGSLDLETNSFVEIVFSYTPTVARILAVEPVDGGLFDAPIQFKDSIVSLEEAYVRVWCETTSPGDAPLLTFTLEALRGPDVTTTMQPIELLTNGQIVSNPSLSGGRIEVPQDPLTPVLRETLGFNYPNPFNHWTQFYLTVAEDDTEVHFSLFNIVGQLVYETTETFDAGDHKWMFVPEELFLDMSQGAYFMRMETRNGSYHTSCVFLR